MSTSAVRAEQLLRSRVSEAAYHPHTHQPTCPPESGRDRVALMILTCLRRPFQLKRVGGLVDSRARGPSTPTQGNMRAAQLQTALKDTLCTVAVHDFHKVLGGESETQSS